jgi:hypothetical protein
VFKYFWSIRITPYRDLFQTCWLVAVARSREPSAMARKSVKCDRANDDGTLDQRLKIGIKRQCVEDVVQHREQQEADGHPPNRP